MLENDKTDPKLYEIKKAKLTGNEVIIQHNNLVDAPRILSMQEQKLFMFLVSKINPDDKEFFTFRVAVEEFAKAVGVNNTKNTYRDLQEISKRLMSKVITIHLPEEKIITQTNILDYIDYHYGKGYADIRLSHKLSPYLLGLKREFTQYKLSQITKLSSLYAIRIYEMLKKQENFGKRTFFIDDLRKKLNISDNKLKAFKDFRLKVLEIAKREINSKTDILIDFKFIKTGKKITATQFDIVSKDEKTEKQKELYCINNKKDPKQVKEIMQFGFSASQAANMLDSTDNSDAENAIKAVKNQIKKGNVKNPKAIIKTALKEKWHDDSNDSKSKKNKIKEIEKIEKSTLRKTGFMKIFEYLFRR
jgi:plasmid replication initiation protein